MNSPSTSTIHLLNHAQHEILRLRRDNQILAAKAEVLDILKAALLGRPSGGEAMSVDIVWELEREEQRLREQLESSLAQEAPPQQPVSAE